MYLHWDKKLTFIALITENIRGIPINTKSPWEQRRLTAERITLHDFVALLDPNLDDYP